MEAVRIVQTEQEYCRALSSYWIFCLRIRYGKNLAGFVLASFLLTSALMTFSHPELGLYPALAILLVMLCTAIIVAVFDYFQYRLYLKKVLKSYREHNLSNEFELKFDDQQLLINGRGKDWSEFRYYYINQQDIYLFKNKRDVGLIWSEGGEEKAHFKSFAGKVKDKLKILPASKQILTF